MAGAGKKLFRSVLCPIALAMAVLWGFASEAGAATREYPQLYKSPRAMGMGGAAVAVGGRFDSVFYNPAGLGKMPVGNWEVNVLGIAGQTGDDALDFIDDLQEAFDEGDLDGDGETDDDQLRAVNDVLRKYRGKNLHIGLQSLISGARNSGRVAYGLGGVGSLNVNMSPHQGFGPEGLLEVRSSTRYGGVGGVSYRLVDGLHAGASAKFIFSETLDHFFTALDLVKNEDNLENYITDDLVEEGSAAAFDAGVIYDFLPSSWLRPSVGVSALNIGDLDFGDAGVIPMTVNVGVAVRPDIYYFHALTVGLDYVDVLNNFEEDDDPGKRLRLGGELVIFDNAATALAVRSGLYQGYATFGAEIRLAVVTLSYLTYAEELGAYAGQDEDRRHLLMLNIGW